MLQQPLLGFGVFSSFLGGAGGGGGGVNIVDEANRGKEKPIL
jgi:hypothetical protein